ncbi:ATP-binding protein [Streptomyces sp. NPDC050315]|uniref:ATP-binding protein n=1 Tax=Streptomyces sp. NPDC050315 TaxID=3155039 RepID=UPI003419ECC2
MNESRLLKVDFTYSDLPLLRVTLAAALRRAGLAEPVRNALAQATLEAVVNAVLHGGGSGQLIVRVTDGEARCEVIDSGPGPFALPLSPGPPARDAAEGSDGSTVGGHGLRLAEVLTDRIEVHPNPGGRGTMVVLAASLDRSPFLPR